MSGPYGDDNVELTLQLVPNPSRKRRSSSVITPDNAEFILSTCFDVVRFGEIIRTDPSIGNDDKSLLHALKSCVKDSEVR